MIIILIIYYLLFIRMHTQWKFNRIVIKLHTYAVETMKLCFCDNF